MAEGDSFKRRLAVAVREAIDYGLLTLSGITRQSIYHCLSWRYGISRDGIPDKLEDFHRALEELVGTGAKAIEELISHNLYQKLGLDFEGHDDWTLIEYVRNAERIIEGVTRITHTANISKSSHQPDAKG